MEINFCFNEKHKDHKKSQFPCIHKIVHTYKGVSDCQLRSCFRSAAYVNAGMTSCTDFVCCML